MACPAEQKPSRTETDLKKAILSVIAFFDLFDYPLTVQEVWQWLGKKSAPAEVLAILDHLAGAAGGSGADDGAQVQPGSGRPLAARDGFYFLSGRSLLPAARRERYAASARKMKRAAAAARVFSWLPWTRFVALGNIMGARNLKTESDLDIFIIAAAGRAWLVRFFCAGLAKLFGWRPRPGKHRDQICLNFFAAADGLDFSAFLLPAADGQGADDPYFAYWLANLRPFYDAGGFYARLISANPWFREKLPNWRRPAEAQPERPAAPGKSGPAGKFFDWLEARARRWQIWIMPPALSARLNQDTRVRADEKTIKLHTEDRRADYRRAFREKLVGGHLHD